MSSTRVIIGKVPFVQIQGVFGGCKEMFVDFNRPKELDSPGVGKTGLPVRIVGDFGITVGEPGTNISILSPAKLRQLLV